MTLPPRAGGSDESGIYLSTRMSSISPETARYTLSPAARWGRMSAMVAGAIREARGDGNPVGIAASQLAYGVAAALNAPGAPAPAIADNELGGVVFFWKGINREIQIEIDADTSHFVQIKGIGGNVTFSEEGFGPLPIDQVNAALRAWAEERSRGMTRALHA